MSTLEELRQRIERLEDVQREMVRPGIVHEVFAERHTIKVQFPDTELITDELPVLVPAAHRIQVYALPDVGDQVLCVFLPPTLQVGFAIGAYYSDEDVPPITDPDKVYLRFGDEAYLEYDRSTYTLQAVAPKMSLRALGAINIDALQTSLNKRNVRPVPDGI